MSNTTEVAVRAVGNKIFFKLGGEDVWMFFTNNGSPDIKPVSFAMIGKPIRGRLVQDTGNEIETLRVQVAWATFANGQTKSCGATILPVYRGEDG